MAQTVLINVSANHSGIGFPNTVGAYQNGKIQNRHLSRWLRELDVRDRETAGHSRRVTDMTLRLCCEMRLSDAERGAMQWGALLHDIGKLQIPAHILRKAGPLSE